MTVLMPMWANFYKNSSGFVEELKFYFESNRTFGSRTLVAWSPTQNIFIQSAYNYGYGLREWLEVEVSLHAFT